MAYDNGTTNHSTTSGENPTRGRDSFERFSLPIRAVSALLGVMPLPVLTKMLRWFRRTGGIAGLGARYCILHAIGAAPHENVGVHDGVYLFGVSGLRIGRNVSIHPMCYLDATGGIEIGNDVSIAHSTTIMSTSHRFDRLNVKIKDQGVEERPTTIEDDCWIGAHSVLLAGVTIGTGSVVAANSVVTRDVMPRSVVAGSPAKKISDRDE